MELDGKIIQLSTSERPAQEMYMVLDPLSLLPSYEPMDLSVEVK